MTKGKYIFRLIRNRNINSKDFKAIKLSWNISIDCDIDDIYVNDNGYIIVIDKSDNKKYRLKDCLQYKVYCKL